MIPNVASDPLTPEIPLSRCFHLYIKNIEI